MPTIDVTLTFTDAQLTKLNKLRQYYNYATPANEDANGFATLLIREAAHRRWKTYHNDFINVLEAYATATEEEQDQVDAILDL